jgi:hypothetical protein
MGSGSGKIKVLISQILTDGFIYVIYRDMHIKTGLSEF